MAGPEIPFDRVAIGAIIWVVLMAFTRAIVLARVGHRKLPPIAGAIALGVVMALPPWIFIAVGAIKPILDSALVVSIPAGLVMVVASLKYLTSLADRGNTPPG